MDQNPSPKRGLRGQLTLLLVRLSRALTVHAKSAKDTELSARLLNLGQPHVKALTKRRYFPAGSKHRSRSPAHRLPDPAHRRPPQ